MRVILLRFEFQFIPAFSDPLDLFSSRLQTWSSLREQARTSRFQLDVPVLISFSLRLSLSLRGGREREAKGKMRKRDTTDEWGTRPENISAARDGESEWERVEDTGKGTCTHRYPGHDDRAAGIYSARPNLLGGFGYRGTHARTHARRSSSRAPGTHHWRLPDQRNGTAILEFHRYRSCYLQDLQVVTQAVA